ncbi:hypothetical protein [Gordonia zhaorongruii]|uniref:hypothetical protein n=1 Tax=Gordonia zhaorongruii TaxID=2597659 RepID=UPI001049349B|nr:hypothetical protein [Gordonia zhaorongruii]
MTDLPIRWWSQPFPPEGGGTAEGIKKALGRPSLPEFAILVREAAQNSWDARTGNRVSFKITLRRLGGDAVKWRQLIGSATGSTEDRQRLARLHSESWVLTVSDRGTSGLGGPLRSDELPLPGQESDFVQFIRNFGEPRDTPLGGGTYGFGKGIFYRVSKAGAILVDTLNGEKNEFSRRLMGAALGGTEFDQSGHRFTGRHWWGVVKDDIPDPIVGEDAASIADQLGLPGFADERTGTDVTVILPDLALDDIDGDSEDLAVRLRSHLYWYLWPKMVRRADGAGIDFAIEIDGRELEFPLLEDLPVFADLETALHGAMDKSGTPFQMPTHQKRYGFLGQLSIESTMPTMFSGAQSVWNSMQATAPISAPYRHVARMRQTQLVVDYFAGEPMPNAAVGYVGAFVSAASVDEYFAQAEPPTHDAWEIGALVGSARGIVRASRTFLADECRKQVEASSGARSKAVQGLGRLSSSLGAIVANATGTRVTGGERPAASKKSGKGGNRNPRGFEVTQASHVVVDEGTPYVEMTVTIPDESETRTLTAHASVILASGQKESPQNAPAGAERTEVLCWYFGGDSSDRVEGGVLETERSGPWTARARFLDGVAVKLTVVEGAR